MGIMGFWELLWGSEHIKFKTDDRGQKAMAKQFWEDHEAVLFTAPTSEPQLLSIVRKRPGGKAHHLGFFDGTLLDVIPDIEKNQEVRKRLSANLKKPKSWYQRACAFFAPENRSTPKEIRLGDKTIAYLSNQSMGASLSIAFLGQIGASLLWGTSANVKFEGAYTTPLADSYGRLLADLQTVGEFDISRYQGEKYLTFVTRLYYADKYHFDFRNKDEIKGQVAMAGAPVGGKVNAAGNQANASIAVYDNTDKTKDPIAFAARMLRVKVVPSKDNPNMAAFQVDTLNSAGAGHDKFTDVAELTAETIEELVEDGDARLLSNHAIGHGTDETTVLHSLDTVFDDSTCHTLDPKNQTYRLDVENENSLMAWCAIL